MTETSERMTDERLMNHPEDGFKHEYVYGEVTSVPTSGKHDEVILKLALPLRPLLSGRGALSCGQAGFRMANGNMRVSDLSFMAKERRPGGKVSNGFGDHATDLCVEVIPESERQREMYRKLDECLANGACKVLQIFPDSEAVVVYTPTDDVRVFEAGDTLIAGDIAPEFRCRVATMFEDIT
jgi:Uma2 family endonuclease